MRSTISRRAGVQLLLVLHLRSVRVVLQLMSLGPSLPEHLGAASHLCLPLAGLYAPAASSREEQERLISAGGDGITNTINNAELAGIKVAIAMGWKDIATDSASSLYQIRRAVLDPMSLRTHLHRELLESIVSLINASSVPIRLYKVKAHSGVIGNECADVLAKEAALRGMDTDIGLPKRPEPHRHMYWLETQAEGENEPRAFPDMGKSHRDHVQAVHRHGTSNQESVYFQASKEAAAAASKGSYALPLSDPRITDKLMKFTLKANYGLLWNQKLAHRYKKAATPNCPLCGCPDSMGHCLSGPCKSSTHAGLVRGRHDTLLRDVLKAISKGTKGAELKAVDAGATDKAAAEGCDFSGLPTVHALLTDLL